MAADALRALVVEKLEDLLDLFQVKVVRGEGKEERHQLKELFDQLRGDSK